ncbi:hypothetical protein V1509DRAFT_654403 [Lipomyces kononenkoae]
MILPSPESGFVPRRPRTWQELFDRDGVVTLIGRVRDRLSPRPPPATTYFSSATLQAAHIIPFSAIGHAEVRQALSIFAGQSVETLLTGSQINDPSNGLLLDPTTHSSFGSFQFGIECRDKIYRLRKLYPDIDLPEMLARHDDEEQLLFGCKSHSFPRPSSLLCNVHLAIGYVTILAILEDEEEFNSGSTGGDYWLVTGASYLERKLRGLAASNYSDTVGSDSDEEESLVKGFRILT